jgi:CPA2 family monovalent cation:H+ antiporter-2
VLLPPLTGLLKEVPGTTFAALAEPLAITLAKVAAFVAVMLLVGRRVIPWILHYIAHTGSRELFRLSVLAIALGVAYGSAVLFDVSFALGAFFAGMILSESALSQRAAQESLPLRDAFAVLFFVSVGMLFDPGVIMEQPGTLLATVFIIFIGKSVIGYGIMVLFRYPRSTALTIAATRGQIGEFSFILAGLGVSLGLLPLEGRDLILAAAILSILMNPLAFAAIDRWSTAHVEARPEQAAETAPPKAGTPSREPIPMTQLVDHVVLVGHGRVGSVVGGAIVASGTPLLVIEADSGKASQLRARAIETIVGNAADSEVVRAANFPAARCLVVAIPDGFEAGQVVEQARNINRSLRIIARGHSEEEIAHLRKHGATTAIMGEDLIANAMIDDIRSVGLLPDRPAVRTDASPLPAGAAHPEA